MMLSNSEHAYYVDHFHFLRKIVFPGRGLGKYKDKLIWHSAMPESKTVD